MHTFNAAAGDIERTDDAVGVLLASAGLAVPDILLPDPALCDYRKWSVVACDQFTSQPAYWRDVDSYVGGGPSALRLIMPEIYLPERPDGSDIFMAGVGAIHKKMDEYIAGGVFMQPFSGFILTEREIGGGDTGGGGAGGSGAGGGGDGHSGGNGGNGDSGDDSRRRWGLVLAVDLERYSFEKDARTLIRSSEETVHNRLPPRTAIRRGAALELPHVLMLMDDAGRTIIEPLAEQAAAGRLNTAYDFNLMAGGGRIRGYRVEGAALKEAIGALNTLAAAPALPARAGGIRLPASGGEPMLFAVGDGNHSLAAAKQYWEELKQTLPQKEAAACPARYALVELINMHSGAVMFEPIHRALFNADLQAVIDGLRSYYKDRGVSIAAHKEPPSALSNRCAFEYALIYGYGGGRSAVLKIDKPASNMPVAELSGFIDDFCEKTPGARVDYIHGEDELLRLAAEEGCFCFVLPPVGKEGFFATIAANGSMPRKSFSMGEARDKRYYLEARMIASAPRMIANKYDVCG